MSQPDPRYPGGMQPTDPFAPPPGPADGPPQRPAYGSPPPGPGWQHGQPTTPAGTAGPAFGPLPPGPGGAANPFGASPGSYQAPAQPLPPRPPRHRAWPRVLLVCLTVLVLAGLVAGSYALARGSNPSPDASAPSSAKPSPSPSPSPTSSPVDIGSRETDPEPLTVAEVFPHSTLDPDPGRNATYHVLKTDTVHTKCSQVAAGKVGGVLTKYGCTQAVRATLSAPMSGYVVTAGICNLATAGGAQTAADSITTLGRNTQGNFTGFAAPGASKLATSPTVFALQSYGHYLLYVVIGRTDGKAPTGDTTSQQIVTDLVQTYLTGVIDARANG